MSLNGEGLISDNGDFLLTSGMDESLREVNRVVRTEISGWRTFPTYGTPLHNFVGQPNARETAQEMTQQLEIYLNQFVHGLGIITVRVIPFDEWSVNIFVFANNQKGQVPIARLVYSYRDGISHRVFDPAQISAISQGGQHSIPDNPYLRKNQEL